MYFSPSAVQWFESKAKAALKLIDNWPTFHFLIKKIVWSHSQSGQFEHKWESLKQVDWNIWLWLSRWLWMISHPFQLLPLSECSCKLGDHSFVNDINGLGLDNESLVTCSDLLCRWFGPRVLCYRLRNTTGVFWSSIMLVFYCTVLPKKHPEHISFCKWQMGYVQTTA